MESVFDLPERLRAKARPALIARDEKHFAAVADSLRETLDELSGRLDQARRAPGGRGRQAVDRDDEVRRLSSRLRTLRRFSLDLCLGHMVFDGDPEPVYVGRLGLTAGDGRRLLIDWRSPAAEPFFAATHAHPAGLTSRRRYRWSQGRITDYWDEVFTAEGFTGHAAALDDQSAFIASLGGSRSARMRDVLGTIQADQDAIIRASSSGTLVVEGGPGTGKTVVALHRTAYLLYADPRLRSRRGGVLFVGPHQPYLSYVADVLPSLGEQDVRTCTPRDLVAEGAGATQEPDPDVARLKSSADMVGAIEAAVRFYEEPPTEAVTIATEWADLVVEPADWAGAFAAVEPGTPHNEARDQIWEALPFRGPEVRAAFNRAWPVLDAADLVGDLWTVPAYLRKCAPWLSAHDVRKLQREQPRAWTVSDLPLLDAARRRLGDAEASRRRWRHDAALADQRKQMDRVVDDLIASHEMDDGEGLMPMLRQGDLRDVLVDDSVDAGDGPDPLAGPFAHVVVDEAQELTDAQWRMLLSRCPSGSFTIVGDRAQARQAFTESWRERLSRVGLKRITVSSLTINYRTPREVMAEAAPVIRAVLPDANVPFSVRSTGVPVAHGPVGQLDEILSNWLATHDDGVACVISTTLSGQMPRIHWLTPALAKGLEFDLVVLVEPETFEGAVDRYVAMTRATQRLVILG